ncbi:hypothetical protein [Agromyces sp. H66]|uniref:hypothetical protein n=1 Tax=Agromyces sp. H66 TaxID=2529859 RepID=UPI0010AA7A68|nr:hypothetical protein [Agromyces sp. H66]
MTSPTSTTRPRTAERITTLAETERLAARILDPTRTRPLVLVTTTHGSNGTDVAASVPLDPQRLLDEVGDVADVAVLPTGELSMHLDDLLPDMLQVYGGAGRSYPVGLAADPDWRRSPLRFPGRGAPGRALDQLVSDAVAHAHAAGLFAHTPARTRRVTGEMRGFIAGGSRALVVHDDGGMSTIWAELTAPPTPLEWLLAEGCRVSGTLDEDTNRLVVDELAASDADLADAFPHASVTLALVTAVDGDEAELALHPSHRSRVHGTDVSPNPLDRVDLLLSEGEVVAARVVHLSTGALHLRLSDVDDDEPIVPPLTLIAGGTPWLREDRPLPTGSSDDSQAVEAQLEALDAQRPAAESTTSPLAAQPVESTDATAPPEPDGAAAGAPAVAAPRPLPGPGPRRVVSASVPDAASASDSTTPASVAARLLGPAPAAVPGPSARSALQATQLELEAERARRLAAEQRLADAGVSDSALSRLRTGSELDRRRARELLAENAELRAELGRLRGDRADAARRLREYARRGSAAVDGSGRPALAGRADFIDAEAWVRHEICCAWVERIPACDKVAYPLPTYVVGADFAASLESLDADKFAKAMKAVVDVLTGRAERLDGREVHRLRTSDAGGSPYVVRDDGAHAMRCAIERNTPSARRLHYWVLPGGEDELARIVLHDAIIG